MKEFGATIRKLREEQGISLRKFAKAVGISPTYLSKVERDEFPPPSEETIKKMARLLSQNEDETLALAGKTPSDVSEMVQRRPHVLPTFFRKAAKLSNDNLLKLMKQMEKM